MDSSVSLGTSNRAASSVPALSKSTNSMQTRVYWPRHCANSPSGFIVGWNPRKFNACVATIVPGVDYTLLHRVLASFAKQPKYATLFGFVGGPPEIIGKWTNRSGGAANNTTSGSSSPSSSSSSSSSSSPSSSSSSSSSSFSSSSSSHMDTAGMVDSKVKQAADLWLNLNASASGPRLTEVYCCGYRYRTALHLVYYDQPHTEDWFAARQASLDPTDYREDGSMVVHAHSEGTHMGLSAVNVITRRDDDDALPGMSSSRPVQRTSDLEWTLRQINLSQPIEECILHAVRSLMDNDDDGVNEAGVHNSNSDTHALSVSSSHVEREAQRDNDSSAVSSTTTTTTTTTTSLSTGHRSSATPLADREPQWLTNKVAVDGSELESRVWQQEQRAARHEGTVWQTVDNARRLLSEATILVLVMYRAFLQVILYLLHAELPLWLGGGRLSDRTGFTAQLEIRVAEMSTWPRRWMDYKRRWKFTHGNRAVRLAFYNSVAVVVLDVLIGMLLGYLLWMHIDACEDHMYTLQSRYNAWLTDWITWLMGWPAGLKLNDHLDSFYGNVCKTCIALWQALIVYMRPAVRMLLQALSMCGMLGACAIFGLTSDILAFLTAHVFAFYNTVALLYSVQLGVIMALYRLFMGKKKNVLRNRVDNCEYDLEQTLLGTLLFVVNFFLFPTTTVYYLFFISSRVVILGLHSILTTLVILLSHAPIATLLIWIFKPYRLPGGIYVAIHKRTNSNSSKTSAADAPVITEPPPNSLGTAIAGNQELPAKGKGRWKAMMRSRATYLRLCQRRLPLHHIFFQYAALWRICTDHYRPSQLVSSGLTGQPVPTSPPLVYPKFEIRAVSSLVDFWLFLKLHVSPVPFHVEKTKLD